MCPSTCARGDRGRGGSPPGGKSTLCQLIPRFYDVTGGHPHRRPGCAHPHQHSLQGAHRHRPAGCVLFAGTIYDNIRHGRPDATEAEIAAAAKKAEIYDDILEMPDGFQTYVGERGRHALRRAEAAGIHRPHLSEESLHPHLDEATSALDSVTEARIQGAFDELAKGRTTLIIAHRLSTIRSAERILVIDNNRIAEEGTHEELMVRGGEYASLYNAQKSAAV